MNNDLKEYLIKNNITEKLLIDQARNAWSNIINILKDENNFNLPTKAEEGSVLKEISEKTDEKENNQTKFFYNQSENLKEIQRLIDKLQDFTDFSFSKQFLSPWNKDQINTSDAGYDFSSTSNLVKPNYNIEEKKYDQIRNSDNSGNYYRDLYERNALGFLENAVVNPPDRKDTEMNYSALKLQFTKARYALSKGNFGTRLIMPMTTRHVVIEDLNRNFWVIAQCLSALCKFLFDENSLIPDIFNNLLNEISKLWNSMLTLWMMIQYLSNQYITSVQVIVMPLPENDWNHNQMNNKNKSQEEYIDKNVFLNRIKYLKDKYCYSHLIVLPYMFRQNYYKNYYSDIIYPYLFMYDRNKDKWDIKDIVIIDSQNETNTRQFDINLENNNSADSLNFRDKIYAISDKEDSNRFAFPFSKLFNNSGSFYDIENEDAQYYYGLVRPKYNIEAVYDGGLKINKFNISFEDAARKTLDNQKILEDNPEKIELNKTNEIIAFKLKDEEIVFNENQSDEELCRFTIEKTNRVIQINGVQERQVEPTKLINDFLTPYYKPEIITYRVKPKEHFGIDIDSFESIVGNGILLKIGNFLPEVNKDVNLKEYVDEQQTREGLPTSYQLNLTFNNKAIETITSSSYGIFKGKYDNGTADYGNLPKECIFYKTIIEENGKAKYSLEENCVFSYDKITLSKLKSIGTDVVKNYIEKFFDNNQKTRFCYIIGSIGLMPWHGTKKSKVMQGYYKRNLLTHLFRYVPIEFMNYVYEGTQEDWDKEENFIQIIEDEKVIGYLDYILPINRTEFAFSDYNGKSCFVKPTNGTTWRLPKLYPQKIMSAILTIQVKKGSKASKKYIKVPNDFTKYDFGNLTPEQAKEITQWISDNIDSAVDDIKDLEDSIKDDIKKPIGTWSVYDAQSDSGKDKNLYNWSKYREVAQFDFDYSEIDKYKDLNSFYNSSDFYDKNTGYMRNLENNTFSNNAKNNPTKSYNNIMWSEQNSIPENGTYSASKWG